MQEISKNIHFQNRGEMKKRMKYWDRLYACSYFIEQNNSLIQDRVLSLDVMENQKSFSLYLYVYGKEKGKNYICESITAKGACNCSQFIRMNDPWR